MQDLVGLLEMCNKDIFPESISLGNHANHGRNWCLFNCNKRETWLEGKLGKLIPSAM